MSEARIQTVTGAVSVSVFDGPVLPREHLRADLRWGVGISSDPNRWVDEEAYVTRELKELLRDHGLNLVVDQTCLGMGRDASALARIAAGSRVAVVAATGYASEPFAAGHLHRYDMTDLTGDLLREIGVGLDGASARPGIIVATAWGETPTAYEEKAVRAAARAAIRTGLPVAVDGLGLLEIVLSEGLQASRVSVRSGDPLVQRKIAETGAYADVADADHALALLESGHADRILLSSGVSRMAHLRAYGGTGYGRMFTELLPALGVEDIMPIVRDNPLRWLTLAG
jgi:phosphotriesterase-related protein